MNGKRAIFSFETNKQKLQQEFTLPHVTSNRRFAADFHRMKDCVVTKTSNKSWIMKVVGPRYLILVKLYNQLCGYPPSNLHWYVIF